MTAITINIPHQLGRAQAKAQVQSGFGQMRAQFAAVGVREFQEEWDGDRLSFTAHGMGQTITGRLDVRDRDVGIEIDLPWILAALADKVKAAVTKQGQVMLEDKRRS